MASEPPTQPLGPRPDPYRGEELVTQRELLEELRRSRTRATAGLAIAILALIAGGVAIVLAATDSDESDGRSSSRGASRSSVSNLREDVRGLEDDIDEIQGQLGQDDDAGTQLEELDQRLSQINDRQEQTSQQLQELQDRVDELESQPSPTPTP